MAGKNIIANSDFSAFILPSARAIATTGGMQTPVSSPKVKDEGGGAMALWGESNDFPQKVIADVRQDPEIGTLLDKQARLLYSGGLVWGKVSIADGGREVMEPLPDASNLVIRDWLRRTNINKYLIEAAKDLFWFNNVFPEVVLDKGRNSIVQLCVQAAEECRWAKQSKNGLVETCFINANFPDEDEKSANTIKLPVIDPYYDPAVNLKASTKGFNYIYPLSYPSPGSKFYQMADWNSIRQSGWLAVSLAIPKFKKNLLEKQLTIKYHIEISDQFWLLKYANWNSLDEKQKAQIKTDEVDNFQAMMAGAEQSGNSLFTPFITDKNNAKEYSLWKITPIDDKLKAGMFLEEGKDASLYKMSAIGLHPALVGTMPNNGMGGAGSNIREAYNLHMLSVRPHQDIILEPLNSLVKYYNSWDENVEFRFRNSFMNTLDKGTETSETAA